jgi:MerR family transcriptional regulator, copper efflux regulator
VRITEACQRLGISARMLRYRESLGLLPAVRQRPVARRIAPGWQGRPATADGTGSAGRLGSAGHPGAAGMHRQFNPADLDAVALGLAIEQRYDISPNALAFGLRVLSDPHARAQVAEFGRRIGRIRPTPALAMDFEKERAQRLLGQSPGNSADISQ